jgi:hypothetical protein
MKSMNGDDYLADLLRQWLDAVFNMRYEKRAV